MNPVWRVTADSVVSVTDAVDEPTEHPPTERIDIEPPTTAASEVQGADPGAPISEIDVVAIEADLDGVQAALARLADGTYWTDEVTGEPIPADVLTADPLARRA